MKGIATNTKQTRATTINHINRERVQCVGSPVSWRFCLLSFRRVPAYLFHEKIGSHNEYPYFEDRNCQTRIVRIARTMPMHQIVSYGRQEGYVAASRIPMVKAVFSKVWSRFFFWCRHQNAPRLLRLTKLDIKRTKWIW